MRGFTPPPYRMPMTFIEFIAHKRLIAHKRYALQRSFLLGITIAAFLLVSACRNSGADELLRASETNSLDSNNNDTVTRRPLSTPTLLAENGSGSGYPAPSATLNPNAYPDNSTAATATTALPSPTTENEFATRTAYLPIVTGDDEGVVEAAATPGEVAAVSPTPPATATATVPPTPTVTPIPAPPTPIRPIDFAAAAAEVNAIGQDLGYSKIGFHVTFMEQKGMLDRWMQELDAAGVPFFLKTVDNAEPLYKAQELAKASGVPHTLVFRSSGGVPQYSLPPAEAARIHWEFHRDKFPPELDPGMVWIETLNEVDKNRSQWLAEFALATAEMALADGFRWAAFGWAPGEPEPGDWQGLAMLEFLRLAGENPDRLAIALHEYSLSAENIQELYPYRLGRFLSLFEIADQYGIPRPTVLITEWGWEYKTIPPAEQAMEDIRWAAALYSSFPQVKGAAIWNLGTGCCFGEISSAVRELTEPLLAFNLQTYYAVPRPPQQAATDPSLYR